MEIDLENWMGNLPGDIKKLPITQLAIPGKIMYPYDINQLIIRS